MPITTTKALSRHFKCSRSTQSSRHDHSNELQVDFGVVLLQFILLDFFFFMEKKKRDNSVGKQEIFFQATLEVMSNYSRQSLDLKQPGSSF